MSLEISQETQARLQQEARSAGVSVDLLLRRLMREHDANGRNRPETNTETASAENFPSVAHLQRTNPKEWARYFDAWVDGHRRDIPVLSDESMSRESIYPDLV